MHQAELLLWEKRFLGGYETTNCTAQGFMYAAFTIDSVEARLDGHAGLQLDESSAWKNAALLKQHPVREHNSSNLELGRCPERLENKSIGVPEWHLCLKKDLGSLSCNKVLELHPNNILQIVFYKSYVMSEWRGQVCLRHTILLCRIVIQWILTKTLFICARGNNELVVIYPNYKSGIEARWWQHHTTGLLLYSQDESS